MMEIFQKYMDWTYTNEVATMKTVLLENEGYVINDLIELYLLGHALKDIKLRNKTLRLLFMHIKESLITLSPEQCDIVWKKHSPELVTQKGDH